MTSMLYALNKACNEQEWEDAEKIATAIKTAAHSKDLFLTDDEKSMVAFAIAIKDSRNI